MTVGKNGLIALSLAVATIFASPSFVVAESGFDNLFTLNGPVRAMGVTRTYDDITLTREQLNDCLDGADNLKKSSTELDRKYEHLGEEADQLAGLGEEVDSSNEYLENNKIKTVNDDAALRERAERVEYHNRLTEDYNAWIIKYQKMQENYADIADKFDTDQENFTNNCSKKQYFEEDLIELQKVRQK
jgi:hypothetical protein